MDPKSFYEDASFYLEQVFAAVKERKRFELDPGFQIARQIVESYLPGDPLFVHTIQVDDPRNYLVNKCINVSVYAVRLARQLGYSKERQVEIAMAALLHEVGMCLIPERTIYKKEQLTRKEFKTIQQHSESGYHVLKAYSDSHPYLAEVALQIHERIDGSGYPQGLKGDEIHDYAQVVGLVDIYEALSHSRPQRDRFNHFYVVKEIINTCKTKFYKKHLKGLLNAFSIFPLSTLVRLNSNAVGQVIETYPEQPMRPKLRITFDSQGRKVLTERIVNLPENSLLYIVDSVSDDEIEQLERGHPFQPPGPFEERDFSAPPPPAPQPKDPPAPVEEPAAKPRAAPGDQSGKRPLLGLMILVLLAVGISAWQGRLPVAPSSADNGVPPGILQKEVPQERETSRALADTEAKDAASAAKIAGPFRIEAHPGTAYAAQPEGAALQEIPSPAAKTPGATLVSFQQELPEAPDGSAADRTLPAGKAYRTPEAGPNLPAEAPPAAGSISSVRRPYSLLLASFRSEALTQQAMAIYRDQGLSPYRVRVDLGKEGMWYRLFCGQYANFGEAAAAARTLTVSGAKVKKTRYANLVASNLSDEETEAVLLDLKDRGASPYVVENSRGKGDLFVGAFYTREGAEAQRAELLAQGVQTRVVER